MSKSLKDWFRGYLYCTILNLTSYGIMFTCK
jgi:hypothetical protein